MIRILLVDDQNLVQEGIKSLLEQDPDLKVIGTVKDGRSAVRQINILHPDIVLLDIEMPGMDGITATKYITHLSPQTKVIILSSHEDKKYLTQALMAGAKAYILKSSLIKDLKQAILAVNDGYTHIESRLLAKIFDPTNIKLRDSKSKPKINKVNHQSQKSPQKPLGIPLNQPPQQKTPANHLTTPEIDADVSNKRQPLLSQNKTSSADMAQVNNPDTVVEKKSDNPVKKSPTIPTTVNSEIINPQRKTSNLDIANIVDHQAVEANNLAESNKLDHNEDQDNHDPQPENQTQIYSPATSQFLPAVVPQRSSPKLSTTTNNIFAQLSVFASKSKNYLRETTSKPQVLKYKTQLTQFYQLKIAQSAPIVRSLKIKLAQQQSRLIPIIRHWYQQGWLSNLGLLLLGFITILIIHQMFF